MTEGEMAEYMSTLLGIGELGGSAETGTYDASNAAELLREHLPENITADNFAAQVLGFLTEGEGTVSTSWKRILLQILFNCIGIRTIQKMNCFWVCFLSFRDETLKALIFLIVNMYIRRQSPHNVCKNYTLEEPDSNKVVCMTEMSHCRPGHDTSCAGQFTFVLRWWLSWSLKMTVESFQPSGKHRLVIE